jgi:hypothetical protein
MYILSPSTTKEHVVQSLLDKLEWKVRPSSGDAYIAVLQLESRVKCKFDFVKPQVLLSLKVGFLQEVNKRSVGREVPF